jgi:hypothetical protein
MADRSAPARSPLEERPPVLPLAGDGRRPAPIARRPMPYPYRAMLAICSDLDETPDREVYVETLRFMNTTAATRFGDGVGLETGNTIYFDMPPGQFSYWNTSDRGRAEVRAMIRSGHVDCLHSFGDLATTRAHAATALDELARHDCALSVWIDHAVAPTNFGADIMRGEGDLPGAAAYHADLSTGFGLRYVWRGRVTSVTAQGVRRRLHGILERAHPIASAVTLSKETAKGLLARAGHRKYRMHASNRVLEPSRLRDRRPVLEFLRTNPHWGGVSVAETAAGIGEVLVPSMLERLIERGGAAILYTHLGKTASTARPFTDAGLTALRRLAEAARHGRILVTTTRRLLGYALASGHTTWTVSHTNDHCTIDLRSSAAGFPLTASDFDGLSFYVPDPSRTRMSIDGVECPGLSRNTPDHTGRTSVSFPWRRLDFPCL